MPVPVICSFSSKFPLWSETSLQGDFRLTPGKAGGTFPVTPFFASVLVAKQRTNEDALAVATQEATDKDSTDSIDRNRVWIETYFFSVL
jgi:hypothetical protein